jgi:hypothetical protein
VWDHYNMCGTIHCSKYLCLLKRAVNITVGWFLIYEITVVFLIIREHTHRKHTANSVQVCQFVASYNQLQLMSILINNMMKSLMKCGTSYNSSQKICKICALSSVWYNVISKHRMVMLSVILVTNCEYIRHLKAHYQIDSDVCDICWYASMCKCMIVSRTETYYWHTYVSVRILKRSYTWKMMLKKTEYHAPEWDLCVWGILYCDFS